MGEILYSLFPHPLVAMNHRNLWHNEATQRRSYIIEGKLPAVQEHLHLTERQRSLHYAMQILGFVCHSSWYYPKIHVGMFIKEWEIFLGERKIYLKLPMWCNTSSSVWRKHRKKNIMRGYFWKKNNVYTKINNNWIQRIIIVW